MMLGKANALALAFSAFRLCSSADPAEKIDARQLPNPVCVQITSAISSASDVYYAGSLHYTKDISHWASSSAAFSACSVEPGTAADVGIILRIVGSTRTAFAVKGGGHTSNPGFSSTTGVQIAMYRFSEVTYDATAQTAVIGAGLVWDDVYAALTPHNVNVVGGRFTGVGVAGYTLGGGYSWKTNQYGLTIDTVVAYELVLPNGTVTTVAETSNPDLFFALRGGYNNLGIVTRFTLKTHPQTQIWGGGITYTANNLAAVNAAVAKFSAEVTDPKAAIFSAYNFVLGAPGVAQILFYDGPNPPAGIFDDLLAIPFFTRDIGTRAFSAILNATPSNLTFGGRVVFDTVALLEYTPSLLDVILNETIYWGSHLALKSGIFISYDVEPFLPTIFTHSTSPSAYPPTRSQGLLPLNVYYTWLLPSDDTDLQNAARQSAQFIRASAIAEGQTGIVGAPLYPNYAIYDTPLVDLYGANVLRLQAIKTSADPSNVMGLAGGFKF